MDCPNNRSHGKPFRYCPTCDWRETETLDNRGRKPIAEMTDREIAEETLATMRATQDMVTKFINDFSKSPMFGMLGKMLGGR